MTIIPALQKQKHRSGEAFKMQGQDFNVITDNERLLKVYKLIANKKGFLITNTSSNKIQLFHDETLQDETYVLEVEKTISIKSNSYNGFIYGFQTLIKLLLESNIIEAQTIKDFPFLEERALHLDCGRKYFSFSWIKKLIEDLAWRNMNTLQLHFSDNKGFRIECDTYPSITSEAFLSKKQIRELIDYAHLFGIDVIPSLDSPGHLKAALETLPKYQLPNNDGNGLD
ncbi:MAG TPA: family 20 glycosylhydrolase, partial [Erysipelothrix sp.]